MEQTELEKRILAEAERLFLEKGFDGTSTNDIARAASCTQALVHYYYRTKERLFQQIFTTRLNQVLEYVDNFDYSESGIEDVVFNIVSNYFILLSAHPRLPFFMFNELILNKDRRSFVRETFIKNDKRQRIYEKFSKRVATEISKGNMREIAPIDLLLDILSLVVMSYLTLPLYQDLLEKTDDEVEVHINNRKNEVMQLLKLGLELK